MQLDYELFNEKSSTIFAFWNVQFVSFVFFNDYIVLTFAFVDAGADGLRLDNLSARVNCLLRVR